MSGKMHAFYERQDRYVEGRQIWDQMADAERRELLSALPRHAVINTANIYEAALLSAQRDMGKITLMEFQHRWQQMNRRGAEAV